MPVKRSPIPLAYKLRTGTVATDYKGSHTGGIELLFVSLPDALARRKVIDALEKVHAKMLARESAPELDADQQTAAQVAALGHQVHPSMAMPSRTEAQHNSQNPRCSCPSGNGSLRWPCPVHPPLPPQVPCVTGCSNPDCPEYGATWPGGQHCPTCSGADKV